MERVYFARSFARSLEECSKLPGITAVLAEGKKLPWKCGFLLISFSAMDSASHPDFIIFKQWENFFIGNAVYISYNDKLFISLNNPRKKL